MTRDMDLIRKIPFAIKDQFIDIPIYNLSIDGYDKKTAPYHCDILPQASLIKIMMPNLPVMNYMYFGSLLSPGKGMIT